MLLKVGVQLGALWIRHFHTPAVSSLRLHDKVKEMPSRHIGGRLPRSVNSIIVGKMLSSPVVPTTV